MEFNEKILQARKAANKTQEDVAREIGVTLRMYQKYEHGHSIPKNKRALERALGLPFGYLEEDLPNSVEHMEYIKNTINALMADGRLTEVDLEAFANDMIAIVEDSKRRKKQKEGSE